MYRNIANNWTRDYAKKAATTSTIIECRNDDIVFLQVGSVSASKITGTFNTEFGPGGTFTLIKQ